MQLGFGLKFVMALSLGWRNHRMQNLMLQLAPVSGQY